MTGIYGALRERVVVFERFLTPANGFRVALLTNWTKRTL